MIISLKFVSMTDKILIEEFSKFFYIDSDFQVIRQKSPYNEFMKATVKALKEKYPSKDCKQNFQEATSIWKAHSKKNWYKYTQIVIDRCSPSVLVVKPFYSRLQHSKKRVLFYLWRYFPYVAVWLSPNYLITPRSVLSQSSLANSYITAVRELLTS